MIRLTLKNSNESWYVNPDHIVSIGKHVNQEGNTYVETTVYDGDCIVTESPAEVALKVLEWRLAMERYRAAYAEVIRNSTLAGPDLEEAEQDMLKLAGMEEQGHE